jgi:hypothetical protein
MKVETPSVARRLGWKAPMPRMLGCREGAKAMRRRLDRKPLDLDSLVCPPGPNFPLSRRESRLMGAACGNRSIIVMFEPPIHRPVGGG